MTEYDPDETYELTPEGFEALHQGQLDSLTDEQLIILRLVDGKEARELASPTVREITALTKWYQEVMLSTTIIGMILDGEMYVDIAEDDEPVFSLSSKGKESATLLGFLPEELA